MNILIDTHIFLWAISRPDHLTNTYKEALETQVNTIYLSAISVAELMIKSSIGKLEINFDPVAIALETGFQLLSFSGEDALQLQELPFHHKDPFDRMLITQALSNDYTILTDDMKFSHYSCKIFN
ncbi:MAG: type II toxin-antitoxin system VapC family toxin [Gammaproteobacteria bacterium]